MGTQELTPKIANELYWEKNYSLAEIGKIVSKSTSHVQKFMAKHDIRRRTKKEVGAISTGPKNAFWKGGNRQTHRGYLRTNIGELTAKEREKYGSMFYRSFAYQHRVVMARTLNRVLESNESVHHLNGLKFDNRPENLVVLASSRHRKMHSLSAMQKRIRLLEERIEELLVDTRH